MAADHRSAHPDFPGVPGWGAVLIAITLTAIGFAFDAGSGSKELSAVFATCYFLGCLVAVLAVRHHALFTAVIQPSLILFVSVPGAYFLFTGGQLTGVKDLAINCGYPLIERFPLMFFTSATALLVGLARWYLGRSTRSESPRDTDDRPERTSSVATTLSSVTTKLTAAVASLVARKPVDEAEAPARRKRSQTANRSARSGRTASNRGARATSRTTPRPRHMRPPETEIIEPVAERPRRSRSSRLADPTSPAEPRRRPRPSGSRQSGPPPAERRTGYERTGYDRTGYERPSYDRSGDRPERRRRFDDYQPREPHGRNGNGTHHPISRVRYRGEETDDRADYRTRRRTSPQRDADAWEYDI